MTACRRCASPLHGRAAEKVNEFEEMLEVERERAKERKGERNDLKEEPVGNVSHKSDDKERARSKAAEKVNEFEEMLAVEKERAKERKQKAGEEFGKGSGNVSESFESGEARDKAAEKVNADGFEPREVTA